MNAKHVSYMRLLVPAVVFLAIVDLLLPPGVAGADVFNMPSGQTSLEFVTVANPGNPGELSSPNSVDAYEGEGLGLDRICGAVGYVYQIGKYEVTNAQYCEFLNAVAASDPYELYNPNMSMEYREGRGIIRNGTEGNYTYSLMSGRANKAVRWVSFWDVCRFANWLHNGQGIGDTETGAYTLTPEGIANNTVTRNAEWRFAVTSEDEWYKAAYHKNDGPTGDYWDYPTGSDIPPTAEAPPGTDMVNGSANWDYERFGSTEQETDVGAYTAKPSSSPYGTFDQGGNAWEWNETTSTAEGYGTRGVRGDEASGNAGDDAPGISGLHAMLHHRVRSTGEYDDIGFRVVKSLVWMEMVTVGNPGNRGELSGKGAGGLGPDLICGSVDYIYRIGKFEVTSEQYCEFLNAVAATDTYGLYNEQMDYDQYPESNGCNIKRSGTPGAYTYSVPTDWANRPVNYVSWADAARFANWLHNGQPKGPQDLTSTEDGSYFLNGTTSDPALLAVIREPNATWVIPSENEWYKAAYHKNDGLTGNYLDYPTSSDSRPSNELVEPTDAGNNATFYDNGWTIGAPYYRTEVGAHENSYSPYGTFDQGGNVYEWNETILLGSSRGVRGGSAVDGDGVSMLRAARRKDPDYVESPTLECEEIGFRVGEIPGATEPGNVESNTVWFPDYVPLDPNEYGIKTFEWVYGQTGEYTSRIGGFETVPYLSGPITGVQIIENDNTSVGTNDGLNVSFLASGEWIISTDPNLAAHPPAWSFAGLYDGMIIDQGVWYLVKKDMSEWEVVDSQQLLIDIQDITVPQGHHNNAVVFWYLDTAYSFTALDFHGKESELGLTLPSSAETAGYAATAVEIYALRTGLIAQGDIDAGTGSLNNLAELKEIFNTFSDGFETGSISRPPWLLSSDENWSASMSEAHSGIYSAQAGSVGDDDTSTLSVTLDCVDGDITFYRKVSSEQHYDYLRFYIDGTLQDEWSGNEDWTQVSFPVRVGRRTFEWTYSKDGSSSNGSDTAWIDDIVFP